MTQSAPSLRRFSVHARHVDPHHARVLEEASFEAAAVAYVEDFGVSVEAQPQAEPEQISVIVREIASGREHCFTIDLETGEAAPCG